MTRFLGGSRCRRVFHPSAAQGPLLQHPTPTIPDQPRTRPGELERAEHHQTPRAKRGEHVRVDVGLDIGPPAIVFSASRWVSETPIVGTYPEGVTGLRWPVS